MKNLLIIYPHWPPSNLAGIHRARLIANFTEEFGWKTHVLTVDESHYEEPLDHDITKLVDEGIEVTKTSAHAVLSLFGRRLLGDIGLRGYTQLRRAMVDLCESNSFDFIWIPIPSWYTALLGRVAWTKFQIPFGVDYIDPWVYQLNQHEEFLSRAWWTRQFALFLEPIAIRDAQLISGVAEHYYLPALERTFKKPQNFPLHVSMPYGFDKRDHLTLPTAYNPPWENDKTPYLIYAGAILPHSYAFLRVFLESVLRTVQAEKWPSGLKIRFVGIGDFAARELTRIAKAIGVDEVVVAYAEREPFLQIQEMLRRAFGIIIIGSTEKHYTASKTFQCLLAKRPVFAIFHAQSSAAHFMKTACADDYLITWSEELASESFALSTLKNLEHFTNEETHAGWNPNLAALDQFSSRESCRKLIAGIESILS